MYMIRRTTIEIEEALLERAKAALGQGTIRGTVEAALRRAAEEVEDENARRAAIQTKFLQGLAARIDARVLASEEMWR